MLPSWVVCNTVTSQTPSSSTHSPMARSFFVASPARRAPTNATSFYPLPCLLDDADSRETQHLYAVRWTWTTTGIWRCFARPISLLGCRIPNERPGTSMPHKLTTKMHKKVSVWDSRISGAVYVFAIQIDRHTANRDNGTFLVSYCQERHDLILN